MKQANKIFMIQYSIHMKMELKYKHRSKEFFSSNVMIHISSVPYESCAHHLLQQQTSFKRMITMNNNHKNLNSKGSDNGVQHWDLPSFWEIIVSLEFNISVIFHLLASFHLRFTTSLISLWECNCRSLDLYTSCSLRLGTFLSRITGSLYFVHLMVI